MHNFKELKVWQQAMDLVKEVYKLTDEFPKKEKYALVQQINRSVVSIPSNIAEGAGRSSDQAFYSFLDIALGSCYELETQLILSADLDYINKTKVDKVLNSLNQIQKMIYKLQKCYSKQT